MSEMLLGCIWKLFCSCFLFPHSELWKATVELPRGVPVCYRYFKGYFLEPKVCTTFSILSWLIPSIKKSLI